MRRVVAIVGRPNVGKSALFNRIAGRRIAIVHSESGVTRDRLACEVEWDGQAFELVDTGGISLMDGKGAPDELAGAVQRQVECALEDASVIIMVVDVTTQAPLDEDIARRLHAGGRTVLVAANKADNDVLEADAAVFSSLGFDVYPVSALHNRGIGDLMEAVLARLPPVEAADEPKPLKVVILGRPNVGKSSYINRLIRLERVVVSEVPGTTRDSVEIPFTIGAGAHRRHYRLVDTAGIRRPARARRAVDKFSLIRTEESARAADIVVLMIDAVAGPGRQEKKIGRMILDLRKGGVIVVNKWDLAREQGIRIKEYSQELRRELPFLSFLPVVFVSAVTGYNVRRSVEVIDYVAEQVDSRLPTGLLNRVLHDAAGRVQPPLVRNRRLKIYYAVQTGTRPVVIRLFVNHPWALTDNYRAYLERELRKGFGLNGAPLVLEAVARRRESSE